MRILFEVGVLLARMIDVCTVQKSFELIEISVFDVGELIDSSKFGVGLFPFGEGGSEGKD